MKNQRRFAPTKTGRFAPEQVAAFLRNQWPESAEYAVSTGNHPSVNRPFDRSISVTFASLDFYPFGCHKHIVLGSRVYGDILNFHGEGRAPPLRACPSQPWG